MASISVPLKLPVLVLALKLAHFKPLIFTAPVEASTLASPTTSVFSTKTLPVEAFAYNLLAVAFLIATLPVEALASISPVTLLLSLMLPVLATALTLVNV